MRSASEMHPENRWPAGRRGVVHRPRASTIWSRTIPTTWRGPPNAPWSRSPSTIGISISPAVLCGGMSNLRTALAGATTFRRATSSHYVSIRARSLNAYIFDVNPGVQADYTWYDDTRQNGDYDAVWELRTTTDQEGMGRGVPHSLFADAFPRARRRADGVGLQRQARHLQARRI